MSNHLEKRSYLEKNSVQQAIQDAVAKVLHERPENPLSAIADYIKASQHNQKLNYMYASAHHPC